MGQLDVKQYKRLKAAGKVTIQPYGEEVVVIQKLFDPYTGEPQDVPAIINVAQIKQQQVQSDKQVEKILEEKENFDELIADIEAVKES